MFRARRRAICPAPTMPMKSSPMGARSYSRPTGGRLTLGDADQPVDRRRQPANAERRRGLHSRISIGCLSRVRVPSLPLFTPLSEDGFVLCSDRRDRRSLADPSGTPGRRSGTTGSGRFAIFMLRLVVVRDSPIDSTASQRCSRCRQRRKRAIADDRGRGGRRPIAGGCPNGRRTGTRCSNAHKRRRSSAQRGWSERFARQHQSRHARVPPRSSAGRWPNDPCRRGRHLDRCSRGYRELAKPRGHSSAA
jgi:hypothetical protein